VPKNAIFRACGWGSIFKNICVVDNEEFVRLAAA
jgi:hypothetical protein